MINLTHTSIRNGKSYFAVSMFFDCPETGGRYHAHCMVFYSDPDEPMISVDCFGRKVFDNHGAKPKGWRKQDVNDILTDIVQDIVTEECINAAY